VGWAYVIVCSRYVRGLKFSPGALGPPPSQNDRDESRDGHTFIVEDGDSSEAKSERRTKVSRLNSSPIYVCVTLLSQGKGPKADHASDRKLGKGKGKRCVIYVHI